MPYFQPTDVSNFLSSSMPKQEGVTPAAGTEVKASRDDHVHARLSSAIYVTLDANGEATVNYTRLFDTAPVVVPCFVESANNQPVVFKIKNHIQDANGKYTGCVIKGYRSQPIPKNLATLLLSTVFNLFAGNPSGISVSVFAIQQSG